MEEEKLAKDINILSKDDTEIDVGMIIKALECCKQNEIENTCGYCLECPASDCDWEDDEIGECVEGLYQATINLIHRLQSDKDKLYGLNMNLIQNIADQKSEIERLTKLVDKWENAYGSEYWLAKHNEMLKEILQEVDKESNGQTVSVTNVLRKRYGVEVE